MEASDSGCRRGGGGGGGGGGGILGLGKGSSPASTSDVPTEHRQALPAINKLPTEVLIRIFRHLNPSSLGNAALTQRKWYAIIDSRAFWHESLLELVDHCPIPVRTHASDSVEYLVRRHFREAYDRDVKWTCLTKKTRQEPALMAWKKSAKGTKVGLEEVQTILGVDRYFYAQNLACVSRGGGERQKEAEIDRGKRRPTGRRQERSVKKGKATRTKPQISVPAPALHQSILGFISQDLRCIKWFHTSGEYHVRMSLPPMDEDSEDPDQCTVACFHDRRLLLGAATRLEFITRHTLDPRDAINLPITRPVSPGIFFGPRTRPKVHYKRHSERDFERTIRELKPLPDMPYLSCSNFYPCGLLDAHDQNITAVTFKDDFDDDDIRDGKSERSTTMCVSGTSDGTVKVWVVQYDSTLGNLPFERTALETKKVKLWHISLLSQQLCALSFAGSAFYAISHVFILDRDVHGYNTIACLSELSVRDRDDEPDFQDTRDMHPRLLVMWRQDFWKASAECLSPAEAASRPTELPEAHLPSCVHEVEKFEAAHAFGRFLLLRFVDKIAVYDAEEPERGEIHVARATDGLLLEREESSEGLGVARETAQTPQISALTALKAPPEWVPSGGPMDEKNGKAGTKVLLVVGTNDGCLLWYYVSKSTLYCYRRIRVDVDALEYLMTHGGTPQSDDLATDSILADEVMGRPCVISSIDIDPLKVAVGTGYGTLHLYDTVTGHAYPALSPVEQSGPAAPRSTRPVSQLVTTWYQVAMFKENRSAWIVDYADGALDGTYPVPTRDWQNKKSSTRSQVSLLPPRRSKRSIVSQDRGDGDDDEAWVVTRSPANAHEGVTVGAHPHTSSHMGLWDVGLSNDMVTVNDSETEDTLVAIAMSMSLQDQQGNQPEESLPNG